MYVFKAINLALRFMLELCILAAVSYAGYRLGPNVAVGYVLGAVFALGVATVWGMFIAPKASRPLAKPQRIALELVLFAGACTLLAVYGHTTLALYFAAAVVANEALLAVWKQ